MYAESINHKGKGKFNYIKMKIFPSSTIVSKKIKRQANVWRQHMEINTQ
jgi:hypothetical protein